MHQRAIAERSWIALCVGALLVSVAVVRPVAARTNVTLDVLTADTIGMGLSLNLQQWNTLATNLFTAYGCSFPKMCASPSAVLPTYGLASMSASSCAGSSSSSGSALDDLLLGTLWNAGRCQANANSSSSAYSALASSRVSLCSANPNVTGVVGCTAWVECLNVQSLVTSAACGGIAPAGCSGAGSSTVNVTGPSGALLSGALGLPTNITQTIIQCASVALGIGSAATTADTQTQAIELLRATIPYALLYLTNSDQFQSTCLSATALFTEALASTMVQMNSTKSTIPITYVSTLMWTNISITASNTTLTFYGLQTGCASGSDYSSLFQQLTSALVLRNQILTTMCLDVNALMRVFGAGSAGTGVLTQNELSAMASALMYEQQNTACAAEAAAGVNVDWKAWVFGTIAIGIICLLSILGLLLIPFLRSEILFLHIIMFFMAVGVGTLVGDAFLHLLNESLNLGAAYPNIPFRETPVFFQLILSVLATSYFMFIIEMSVRYIRKYIDARRAKKHEHEETEEGTNAAEGTGETPAAATGATGAEGNAAGAGGPQEELAAGGAEAACAASSSTPDERTCTTTEAQVEVGHGVENPALTLEHDHDHDHEEGACNACAAADGDKASSCAGECSTCANERELQLQNEVQVKVEGSGLYPEGAVLYQATPSGLSGGSGALTAGTPSDALAVCHCMDHVVLPNEIAVKKNKKSKNPLVAGHHGHSHGLMEKQLKAAKSALKPHEGGGVKSLALMLIIGDVLHNFADGMAVGVGFDVNVGTGIATSIAIAFHELPHEFSDVIVLMAAGVSYRTALLLNILTGFSAFAGLYIGIGVAYNDTVRAWLLMAILGTFLYVALCDLMPEMMEAEVPTKYLWSVFVCENVGMLLGVLIMALMAAYEELININIG